MVAGKRVARFVLVFLAMALAAAAFSHLLAVTEPWERRLLQVLNPSRPVPGLDASMVLLTDYAMGVYGALLIAWAVGCFLLRRGNATAEGLGRAFVFVGVAAGLVLALIDGLARGGYGIVSIGIGAVALLGFVGVGRGLRRTSADAWAFGVWLFGATLVAALLAEAAEEVIDLFAAYRPRPLASENVDWNQVLRAVPGEEVSKRTSFPSGHAQTFFAMIGPLYWTSRRKAVRVGLLALASVHSVSRLYLVAHYPGCVLAGSAVGFGIGTLVAWSLPFSHAWLGTAPARDPDAGSRELTPGTSSSRARA